MRQLKSETKKSRKKSAQPTIVDNLVSAAFMSKSMNEFRKSPTYQRAIQQQRNGHKRLTEELLLEVRQLNNAAERLRKAINKYIIEPSERQQKNADIELPIDRRAAIIESLTTETTGRLAEIRYKIAGVFVSDKL